MFEFIYINYSLLMGSFVVATLFIFALLVYIFNFFYELLFAAWADVIYIIKWVIKLTTNVIVPLLRVWWIITRAPVFIMLIILNSFRYLLSGFLHTFRKYWRSYIYVIQEDTVWDWDTEQSQRYYTSKFLRVRLANLFKKYLSRVYPNKPKNVRYTYTLAFLWGYWCRWFCYILYLFFYYCVFLFRRILYYVWFKPYIIEMIMFVFYYLVKTMGWWLNTWIYKFSWNAYVFIRRQIYYFIPNWAIADIIQDLNLNWFEWNFEANMSDEDGDTPEDLFMNNPNRKIVQGFYNVLPITSWFNLINWTYPYVFIRYSFTLVLKYLFILPIYLILMLVVNLILGVLNFMCEKLVLFHQFWWGTYKYLLRTQYKIFIFILAIPQYNWYNLLIIPIKNIFFISFKLLYNGINHLIPLLLSSIFSYIMSFIFYFIYSIVWCIYYSPALLMSLLIGVGKLVYNHRVFILSVFLGYYWVYQQYSELGEIFLGMIQSTLEQILRNIWFYVPFDELTRFHGSNKYEFIKYWGALHDINQSRLLHYYSDIWQPDLAYMGYYKLNLLSENNNVLTKGIIDTNLNTWPLYYNNQRGLKFYNRSFIEKEQMQWNLWFLKFVEGTYLWDPVPHLTDTLNQGDFTNDDFKQFFQYKYICKSNGTPVTDLFWFFQEDEMEKWDDIMNSLPHYYLFEPNVLQEESEILPNTWSNWFYYDIIQTPYLIPFDFPIEGNRQGAPGYQPGFRPAHLFAMLNSLDPIEYTHAQGRQRMGLPVLNAMHYVKMLHEFRDSLLARRNQLIRISTELVRDMHIWDEIFSENTEWQMRLFTALAYPFKWFGIRFELIRISIYKYCVFTKTTFWLYYYYYEPKIRIFFYLSLIQKLVFIYPYKWLYFCWQVANSVYPLPQKTFNIGLAIIYFIYNNLVSFILYGYYMALSYNLVEKLNYLYNILPSIYNCLINKFYCLFDIVYFIINNLYVFCISWSLKNLRQIGVWENISENSISNILFSFNYIILNLTWWYIIYINIHIYLSLDQFIVYLSYNYYCYMWYLNHIVQGYIYLWKHSFYIHDNNFSWFTFTEYITRERGITDRKVIYDIVPDTKRILARGYVREMGPLISHVQICYSWFKQLSVICLNKDLAISFINYGFYKVWYFWNVSCQTWQNLLSHGQNYIVNEWRYSIKGWTPMLMVWMNKVQYLLDDIYIYLQLPRRLNKYGLSYTVRGYDMLDELNMMYVLRRTSFGNTKTWKSLNMLTYLVLMVKYPNTWEHFSLLHNSPVFKNANGLKVVASKIFANITAWSSGIYYCVLVILLFISNNFRHLLFATTGNYWAETTNREFKWQAGRSQMGAKLRWLFVSRDQEPYMRHFVELENKLRTHMDYYSKLMFMNSQLSLEYMDIRNWVEQLHKNTLLHKKARGYNYKRSYLSPMSITYLLNPYYYSLYTNVAYSSNNFNKFMAYAQIRDRWMAYSGKNVEINRAYSELHPTYTYHTSYINLHMKQLDHWYYNNFNLDKYFFNYKLPDWAWHKDGFNMRIFASKNPVDLTQQLTYVYEDERNNYIPWALFGWFLAIPLCLVIKPLAGLGQWLQHSGKEEPAWAWHFSYYINNLWHHVFLFKYFYYAAGPWIPETKLLASLDTEESEDYWHYHPHSAFMREFFYSYEEQEPVDIYQLLYTDSDFFWHSSLEEVRLFFLFSIIILFISLLFAVFKKIPNNKVKLNQFYSGYYIHQWDSIKYYLPSKHHLYKIYSWFWR